MLQPAGAPVTKLVEVPMWPRGEGLLLGLTVQDSLPESYYLDSTLLTTIQENICIHCFVLF